MQSLLLFLICINILLIIALGFGMIKIFNEETNPKIRAWYSVFLSVLLFLYLGSVAAAFVRYIFLEKYSASPFLFMFFIFPFAIGNFASYKKLKLFTLLQILIFAISLVYIIYLYVNFKQI